MPDYITTIEVKVRGRYEDAEEAHIDADMIATHIREETGNMRAEVDVASVVYDGESEEL